MVRIGLQHNAIRLKIEDDGRGFDMKKVSSGKREKGHGLGLTNMRERALSLGGTCEILSPNSKKAPSLVSKFHTQIQYDSRIDFSTTKVNFSRQVNNMAAFTV